jgi:hypothetical protein
MKKYGYIYIILAAICVAHIPYPEVDKPRIALAGVPTPPGDPVVKLTWKTMQSIKYEKKYYKEIEGEMLAPLFTDELKQLDGKMVEVEGYIVPIDEKWRYLALSANPYAACFFCGKAGPASVMTVKFKGKSKKRYNTDDYKRFKGRLRLNYNNVDEFYFVLENSEEM